MARSRCAALPALLSLAVLPASCRAPDGIGPEAPGAPLRAERGSVTLTSLGWWLGEEPVSLERIVAQFTRETGIAVKLVTVRESPAEDLGQYLRLLKNESSPGDVYQVDVTWTAILAEHLVDLEPFVAEDAKAHIPVLLQVNTVDGRLVGLPYFADFGVLFYRTDLLLEYGFRAPPRTWDELERMAARIQAGERAKGNQRFWGFVWQGADYEGLTCGGLEWQASHGGGRIIEADGTITVNNPGTLKALRRAVSWLGRITPRSVTAYREEDARNLWQSGNAAFMRNWPRAYGMARMAGSPVRGKFDVTLLPDGGAGHAAAMGGWQLAVSRYSKHRREAVEFVRYMTGRRVQLERTLALSYLPTITSLYDDPQVLAVNPHFARLKDTLFEVAVARPSAVTGQSYPAVSRAYSGALHAVLSGKASPERALADLETRLLTLTGPEPKGH